MFKKTKEFVKTHKDQIIGGTVLVGGIAAYVGWGYYVYKKGNARYASVESIVGKDGMKKLAYAADNKGIWMFGDGSNESWKKVSEIIQLKEVQAIINEEA